MNTLVYSRRGTVAMLDCTMFSCPSVVYQRMWTRCVCPPNIHVRCPRAAYRARSLVWLERPAHNRVATGSNPVGPTSFLNELGRELLGGGANSFGDEEHRAAELSRN